MIANLTKQGEHSGSSSGSYHWNANLSSAPTRDLNLSISHQPEFPKFDGLGKHTNGGIDEMFKIQKQEECGRVEEEFKIQRVVLRENEPARDRITPSSLYAGCNGNYGTIRASKLLSPKLSPTPEGLQRNPNRRPIIRPALLRLRSRGFQQRRRLFHSDSTAVTASSHPIRRATDQKFGEPLQRHQGDDAKPKERQFPLFLILCLVERH